MWLWNNPVLRRELSERLGSWKTLAAVLAVVTVSSGLVLLRWPSDATVDVVSQGAMLVFRPLACALTLAVMMLVPSLTLQQMRYIDQRCTLRTPSDCRPAAEDVDPRYALSARDVE